jgi:SAM-dependent methyltransferase
MHPSAYNEMKRCIETYMPRDRGYDVVDFGSRCSPRQAVTHRDLLRHHTCTVTGVDIKPGRNVDMVMKKPYQIPLRRGSADVVLSGQTFEHIPFFWVSMFELARILRPGGFLFITVPSRGHVHDVNDCWRFYPDGMHALAAFSGLELVEARTDFPPRLEGSRRHDYGSIDTKTSYWGDTVGVFRKRAGARPLPMWVARYAVRWWANRLGDLGQAGTSGRPAAARSAVGGRLSPAAPTGRQFHAGPALPP